MIDMRKGDTRAFAKSKVPDERAKLLYNGITFSKVPDERAKLLYNGITFSKTGTVNPIID